MHKFIKQFQINNNILLFLSYALFNGLLTQQRRFNNDSELIQACIVQLEIFIYLS